MGKLFLVRHGESEWNHLGKWTGKTDIDLTEKGREEARRAAAAIKDFHIDKVCTSSLRRTHQTLDAMCEVLDSKDFSGMAHPALDERDYGVYTGKNKWEAKEAMGEEAFQQLRRGWNVPVPEGESLKDVHDRVVPFFEKEIAPTLKEGKNVLVVAHGNTLRALAKRIENMDDVKVCEMEIGTGEVHCYDIDEQGEMVSKEVRASNEQKLKV